jgi:hypothetical protein
MYDIENYILKKKKPPNYKQYLINLHVEKFDNRINFILFNGTPSSPLPKVYTTINFENEIKESTERYLSNLSKIELINNNLILPFILEINKKEFGYTDENIINFVYNNVNKEKKKLFENFFLIEDIEYNLSYSNLNFNYFLNNDNNNENITLEIVLNNKKYIEIFKGFFFIIINIFIINILYLKLLIIINYYNYYINYFYM